MTIFKAYDIRGIYPSQLDEELAYKIGRAFVTFLKCKEVVVGYDMRKSQKVLTDALYKGITDQGANVINIGLASTPMLYFAASKSEAAIMITASHNSGEYNGFKLCRANATPISGVSGIREIEQLCIDNNFSDVSLKGEIINRDIKEGFILHNLKFLNNKKMDIKVVFDFGNGIGGYSHKLIWDKIDFNKVFMYDNPDGSFPNHEANPLKMENVVDLQKRVVDEKADFGVSTDGDCDRCMFIDENGEYISADLITALVAKELLKKNPNATILSDLRSSKVVEEVVKLSNGNHIMCRVGHAFIKQQMKEENALFAGELSGHFYYRDSFTTESSIITVMTIMNLMIEENKKMSELIAPLRKYFASGEINSTVSNPEKKMEEILEKYNDAKITKLDGISVELDDFWFNVRKSNTEPKLRLNLEAKSKEIMQKKRDELLELIRRD